MPTYGETPTTLDTHTTPYEQQHASAYTPHPRYVHSRYDIRMLICTMATHGSASAASEIEVGSIYPTMLELRAAAAKQAENAYVARVVW